MDSSAELLRRVNENAVLRRSHITLTALSQARSEGVLAVGPDSLNPHGMVHGGLLSTLADTAAGAAASAGGGRCVTVCSTMNYLRPALGPEIRCTALPQRVGRRVAVYETRLTDARGELVATGVFTFQIDRETPAEEKE